MEWSNVGCNVDGDNDGGVVCVFSGDAVGNAVDNWVIVGGDVVSMIVLFWFMLEESVSDEHLQSLSFDSTNKIQVTPNVQYKIIIWSNMI